VAAALEEYSVSGRPEALESAFARNCACLAEWREVLEAGNFPFIAYDALLPR
jgi:uncharacterized protein (DUF2237 family)